MKKVDVVLGLQWGDEGKGKVVDVLTPNYQAIARFQGGPNAGHSLKFEGKKDVLALTSFGKEVNGYGSLNTSDTELKPFANSGGFAQWLSSQTWDEGIIDKIYDWFDKPIKIKLTTYYLPQGSTRKTCSLTNIIKE